MPFKANILLLLLLLAFTAGCSNEISVKGDSPEAEAVYLFERGNDAMREENYVLAVKYFTRLKEDYPFSPYTVEAELSLGDCYYLDDEWLLAADAYKEFEAMHPRHEAMPYVLYQIGMSNMNTYVSVDRPPTLVADAYSYFRRLVESFPTHEYVSQAEFQMYKCRRIMAEYEVYTGDFMYRTENYMAAWRRYMIVIGEYKDFPDLVEYSERRRHIAYFLHMKNESEQTRRVREGTWHNLFNWL